MYPGGVAVDAGHNVYIASTGANRIYVVNGGVVTQVIGNGSRDYAGDGSPAISASMSGPLGVALDSQGSNLYIADSYNSVVRKVTISNGMIGTITTVAGTGTAGNTGDMGPATSAQLNSPDAVAVDLSGNIYIADAGNNVIRVVSTAGTITTVANPAGVTFNAPAAVAVNGSDLYIADTGNNMIRKLSGGIWSVVAGTGTPGFNGDTNTTGVTPATAELYHPSGVVVDGSGNVYIGDTYNQRIRKVNSGGTTITTVGTPPAPAGLALDQSDNLYVNAGYNVDELDLSNGQISTLAGNGSYEFSGDGGSSLFSQLNQPSGVAVDNAGNVYIADTYNSRIREVLASGSIVTVAGNGMQGYTPTAGNAANSQFNLPSGVAVDSAGNLYIADTFNHVIEKIVMLNGMPKTFSVVAGTNNPGYNGDNIPATQAELNYPWSVAVDRAGNLYIADSSNCRIREVLSSNNTIITLAGGT
jgi:DNA-binding beta-propeller fold protein YncE